MSRSYSNLLSVAHLGPRRHPWIAGQIWDLMPKLCIMHLKYNFGLNLLDRYINFELNILLYDVVNISSGNRTNILKSWYGIVFFYVIRLMCASNGVYVCVKLPITTDKLPTQSSILWCWTIVRRWETESVFNSTKKNNDSVWELV